MHRHLIAALAAVAFISTACLAATPKVGIGADRGDIITGVNSSWYYNWGLGETVDEVHAEFVPMFWSGGTVNSSNIQSIIDAPSSEYVLGFNEPDREKQSNMTVATAINKWGDLQTLRDHGIKLVSPAVSDNAAGRAWLAEFMEDVGNDPTLEVDEVAFHWYGTVNPNNPTGSANTFLGRVDYYHSTYGLPVWVTEFAGIDWGNSYDDATMQEANRVFLETAIAGLESRSYVTRYSWWNHSNDSRLLTTSDDLPTVAGEGWIQTIVDPGEVFNINGKSQGNDVFYLRGGELTNTGNSNQQAVLYLDASEGSSTISGTNRWDVRSGGSLWVRGGAALYKRGANTVVLKGIDATNDGLVVVEEGTLQFELETNVAGLGSYRVDPDGVLAMWRRGEDADIRFNNPVSLNGGLFHAKNEQHAMLGALNLAADSEVRSTRGFLILGSVSGPGKLTTSGTGDTILLGHNTYSGGTVIEEGELVVANPVSSATGAGLVEVRGGAVLRGYGKIGGSVTAGASALVAPGVVRATIDPSLVPGFTPAQVVNAIDFDFTGVQDDAPLTQTSTLSDAVELISGLDFGPGVEPRGAANNNNEFNVAGFSTGTTYGGAQDTGDYLTFTLAPAPGLAMVIEDVTVELRRNGSGAATSYGIATSIDGWAWQDRWGPDLVLDTEETTTQVYTVSNPSSEAVTDEIEVRLVGWNAGSDAGNTHVYGVSVDASFVSDPLYVELDVTGVLELGGSYTQLDFATLAVDIEGASNAGPEGAMYDQLLVSGVATLDGMLEVSFADQYQPKVGDEFELVVAGSISGEFDSVSTPEGVGLEIAYTDTQVLATVRWTVDSGDFNDDGVVDAADYAFWRANMGLAEDALAPYSGDGDGTVDAGDYQLWRSRYGQLSSQLPVRVAAAPEPGGLAVLLAAFIALCAARPGVLACAARV